MAADSVGPAAAGGGRAAAVARKAAVEGLAVLLAELGSFVLVFAATKDVRARRAEALGSGRVLRRRAGREEQRREAEGGKSGKGGPAGPHPGLQSKRWAGV